MVHGIVIVHSIMVCKYLLLIIFLCFQLSNGGNNDTLIQGMIFDNTTFLVSQNGLFTLGFFRTPDAYIHSRSYLGIWYTDRPNRPAWLGNRENPIFDDSGVLTIDGTGKLKITNSGGDVVELFSAGINVSISAVLLNSGNFVVKESNSSREEILWESFDYPSDSLLPGMKLGENLKTGKKWVLNSWLTEDIPDPGAFTLEWDSDGRRLVMRRRGVIYWSSGRLNGNKFEFIIEDAYQFNYNYSSIANSDEEYFTYSLIDSPSLVSPEYANVSQWSLSNDGMIIDGSRMVIGGAACTGSQTDWGCEKWESGSCRISGDEFQLRRDKITNGISTYVNNTNFTMSDCRASCWRDCDCTGFQSYSSGCRLYKGKFSESENIYSVPYYVMILAPRPPSRRDWIWVLIAVVAALLMMLMGIFFYLRRRRLRLEEKFLHELMTFDRPDDEAQLKSDGNNDHSLKIYSVASIKAATNNFSAYNKLGEGGFGPVYKGKLIEGREVAVKRLSRNSGQGLVEFKNELILIAKLQHTNLVRLLGFCIQGEEKMLVYEYMPNKSLDSFIFDPSNRKLLDWKKRLNIIEGIAQGLLYLHRYSRLKIIHRDLKVSNVLLDENMNPKISDFGLARIYRNEEEEANTNRVVGTYGYMSPEYAMEGIFSVKSDVFSFGVIVLEIVSGRKNNSSFMHYERTLNLVGYTWELWKEGRSLELMDPTLSESYSEDEIVKCINVGLLCVEDNTVDRPTMSNVISMLSSEATTLPPPKQPAFSLGRIVYDKNQSVSDPNIVSLNELSITEMNAR